MKLLILIIAVFLSLHSFAQIDTAFIAKLKSLDTANLLKIDTAAVPNDRLTYKIKQLRNEKHGLNTETVMKLKIQEEQAKDTIRPKEFYKKLLAEVSSGHTAQLIENSLINLYRHSFTEAEIDELLRFYKTSAGKKLDKEFILLIVQSVKDGEQLLKLAAIKIQQ